jgi:hypothetical protein
LTFSLLAALASAAQAQVKLEHKVTESKTSKSEVTSRTTQKLTIAGMEIDTESESRTTVKSTAGKRDDNGQVKVAGKVEELQINVKLQGTDYVFDSSNPDKAGSSPLEILRPLHKATMQRITTTTFDKNSRVANIEFDQDPLSGLSDDARKLFKGQFETEKLKAAANQELDRLPTDPVKKGDVWERTSKLNLEGGQVMTLTTRYTYAGETEQDSRKFDLIESQVLTVEYALTADSTLPFTLKASDLKASDSKGKLLFDRQKGEIVSSSATIQIKGDMTFVINNNDLPAKLDLKIETSTQPKD